MKREIVRSIYYLESIIANAFLKVRPERPCLITLLFHGLFADHLEIEKGHVLPGQQVTLKDFEETIDFFKSSGYQCVTPSEISDGLESHGKYFLITFDDGYFNNHLAVSILEKYKVPAVFYISPYYVMESKSYWWDVVYRKCKSRSMPDPVIDLKIEQLKKRRFDQIEYTLLNEFGNECFDPWSDIDRPFSESELKEFSKHPLVTIGNHTFHHAIMTEYTWEENEREIEMAQKWFGKALNLVPDSFSFPNGNVPNEYDRLLSQFGFTTGIGLKDSKNDLNRINLQCINRSIIWGTESIQLQGFRMRAGFRFLEQLINLKGRVKGISNHYG